MRAKYIQLLVASVLFALCLQGCSGNKEKENVLVGDLAHLQLLPGTPVETMSWDRWYGTYHYRFDDKACVINDEPYLVSKDVHVSKSSTGEKNTVVSYEYDDSYVGEMCLTWVFGCTYDSKGRLIYKATGESGHGFVYNDDHQIVVENGTGEGDYWKVEYKYNDDGHCIYEADYYPMAYDEHYDPIYDSSPDNERFYEILEVDDYGNWTARRSSDGYTDIRTITYKSSRSIFDKLN